MQGHYGSTYFMSELRIREIVKRLFTPYQLPLLKRRELTGFDKAAALPS
jgi:hypothetical protein